MAILAAVLVPTVTSKIKDANRSTAISDINAVASTIQADLVSLQSGSTNTTYLATKATAKATDGKINDKITISYTAATTTEQGYWTITHSEKTDLGITDAKVLDDGTVTNATKA